MADRAQILITAVDQTRAALASVKSNLEGLSVAAGKVNGVLAGLGAALSLGALVAAGKAALDTADDLNKLSQKTGISVESLSLLKPVAEQSGISLEGLATCLKKLAFSMVDAAAGSKEQEAVFRRLGVAVTDTAGKLRPTEDVLLDLAEAFSAMPDGAEKSALAVKLFGKAGTEMIPFLNQGKAGIEQLKQKFKELGLEISGSTAAAAEKFNDTMDTVKQALQGIVMRVVEAALPALQQLADALVWVAANGEVIVPVLRVIGEFTFALLAIKGASAAVNLAILALSAGMKIFAADVLLASVSLQTLKAALGPLVLALTVGWEVGKWLNQFKSVQVFGTFMVQALMTGLSYLQLAWESFTALFTSDTVAAAAARHAQRLQEISTISQQMRADINAGITDNAAASTQAASATEAAAVRSKQALADEAAAWKALNDSIKTQYTERLAALDAALQQQKALIEATQPNETAREVAITAAIIAAHAERLAAMMAYQTQALALIEQEKSARLAAMSASGETEKQINLDVANARRAVLAGLLGEYQQHFANLNAQYTAHLAHVQQIEEAKRQVVAGVEATLRDLARETMTARSAYYDKQKEIDELQAASKKALEEGNFKLAQEYAEKSVSLAKSTAQAVTEGDQTIIDKRQAVTTATGQVKESLDLMKKAYDGQGEAAKKEAAGTLAAMNETKSATENLKIAITALDTALQAQHSLTVKTNIPEVKAEINSLNGMNTSSTHTVNVKKVEQNATGGLVGAGISAFAKGGLVQKFAKGGAVFNSPSWSKVPGSGNGDTVPAALQSGSFVIRKNASQYYGDGLLGRIASGVQKFAGGGSVSFEGGAFSSGSDKNDNLAQKFWALVRYIDQYNATLYTGTRGARGSIADTIDTSVFTTGEPGDDGDARAIIDMLKKVASNVNTSKRAKFLQMEKQNPNDAFVQFAKFASGGSAVGSDSIPAMLTPGEWVVKKPAVDKYGLGLMNAINTMSMPREILERMATPPRVARFATGGPVGGDRSAPSSSSYKGSQTGGINLTINAPSGDADAIARAVLPAINRIQGRSR